MDLSQKQWSEQVANQQDAIIIDVRTPAEWAEGIIPNALMINIYSGQEFVDRINALENKDANYYVYCRSGMRSHQACDYMNELGFTNAFNLNGGILQYAGEKIKL